MKKIYTNEDWCLGCHLCEYYCAYANSGISDMVKALKGVAINPRIQVETDGSGKVTFAVACRHCETPYCVKSCITGALSVNDDGVVQFNQKKCVGCYTCILSCPYGCIMPAEEGGVVQKCELCTKNAFDTPACVKGCPNHAIVFEDRGE
jgi:carbon-monoxide dehydrogenase iron sulfur subunit